MPSLRPPISLFLPLLILLIFWARPTHAFGAGNIASTARIEGQNWRHGDIEDTLLTLLMTRAAGGKKFSKMDVKRVYFGNWLRDYSQAVDVGTVKMVSAEAIRILLWILGFLSFGYGTKEFEVTADRLGCYRPEEHIDNPKDYADNVDARDYDRRLRGPIDERRELSVDERNGLKNYIASEDLGITTSAGHVRKLFHNCIELARRYNSNGNKDDLYEALRLLGTALHCLEDYSAHSNYTELALIELGERDVFPHVGRNTRMRVEGARNEIYPLITGTFGGVDFLHSVLGEVSDKVTQSEIQELEGTINNAQQQKENASLLQDLLNKLPDGLFGGKDEAGKADELQQNATAAQMENAHISPREPEEWARQLDEIQNQIRPILEFHDEIMQQISEAIDNIPVLPELIEQIQDQVSIFVFSLLAPFVLPIMTQVKSELQTGSSEVIQSSREKQLIVFNDDDCTDPTHSMLAKDHFSNILNEPAGKIASQVLKWAVPQIVECWDNENIDAERTINRIINGVFHHPALRDSGDDGAQDGRQLMFRVVESWWGDKSSREQDDLRDKLSRDGVQNGRNHKEGVHDTGHGCGKPLSMPKYSKSGGSGGVGGEIIGSILSGGQSSGSGGGGGNYGRQSGGDDALGGLGKAAGDAVGGGALGGLVGGLVGGVGASLLGGAFGDKEKKEYQSEGYNDDGSYTKTYGESGHKRQGSREKYAQAEYSQTYSGGGRREEYSSVQETSSYGGSGYSHSERREKSSRKDEESEEEDDGDDDWEKRQKKERKKREKEEKKRREKEEKYGGYGGQGSDEEKKNKRRSGEHKRRSGEHERRSGEHQRRSGEYRGGYGEERRYGEGRPEGYGGGRQEESGYGRSEGYGGGGHRGRHEESSYGAGDYGGRQEESGYGRGEGYGGGGRSEGYGGGGYGGRQEESGYGGSEGYGGRSEGYGGGGYGGRQEHGGRQEYGGGPPGGGPPGGFPPGGFPGGDEYGGERRRDDEYGERRGYGGGGGYGGGY